jgi:hypothetical protein
MLILTDLIDLSHQKRLRSLHIQGTPSPDFTNWIIQTLASITCTCMDELIFDATYGPYHSSKVEWSEVDAVLQSPQFSTLRRVQFNVVDRRPIIGSNLEWPRLSQCHGRGILSIRLVDEHDDQLDI